MTEQEYKHIRNLAWDLLIDAHISKLPVDIYKIAKIYDLQNYIDKYKSLYNNSLLISYHILTLFGYNNNSNNTKHLALRILSPMIILKALDVQSADEISKLTNLPLSLSIQRLERYHLLLKRNAFKTSNLETKVLSQFQEWIKQNS